ncbi:MAG: UbiD family decarboxylase [Gammaproteobacteria bacterium]|nr:UbiD family decarboxylase [Gammaproteobacteria bacterium]
MANPGIPGQSEPVSRREFIASTGSGLAALAATACTPAQQDCIEAGVAGASAATPQAAPTAPFDTFRDWIAALESNGLLMRFDRVDQDAFHTTGLFFRATDRFGMLEAPAMLFEEVLIDGKWVKGPVIANHQGHWNTDALLWGLEPVPGDHYATYRRAKAHLSAMLERNGGEYPQIAPVEISRDRALCKEVVITGDEIDINRFAFLKTNPADAGRYVNTGSVFMHDPEMGPNFGTYRCQIKGPRKLGMNSTPNHQGYKMFMAAKARGEKTVPVSVVVGQDPVVWLISSSPVVNRRKGVPIDELAVAGGMRGKPIETVKSETNHIMVPAHAEMVIEGEVPLDGPLEREGPFGEMFGYLGPANPANLWMNITTITHRQDPWIMNAYTGMQRGMVSAPMDCILESSLRRRVPNLINISFGQDVFGVLFMSIDKTGPGQGLKSGSTIANMLPFAKVVVVVDKDINVLDRTAVVFAMGSRWQPDPATAIITDARG